MACPLPKDGGSGRLKPDTTNARVRICEHRSPLKTAGVMLRDAVLAGAGVGILPRMLVAVALKDGSLQDWGRLPDAQVEVWALHASRRLTSARVAAFLDFLTEAIPGILR